MTSAPASTSPLASDSGLPCSMVISGAIASARSRSRSAALRMTLERSKAETLRQCAKALVGRLQRAIEVGAFGMRHGADLLAGRRIDDGKGAAARRPWSRRRR